MERIPLPESHASPIGEELEKRVIGQGAAIESIMTALEKARLRDERHPVASLMFLGPTGTGKTQTAEALAEIMGIGTPSLIKIDCGMYSQGHEVAALVGAPPGYVGRSQEPLLNPEILETQGSVLLFDEIEKAHPKLHNLLLQMMDRGTVTLLNSGREVNLSNTILILTSNVGAREMQDTLTDRRIGFGARTQAPEKVEAAATNALKKTFSPEFINRLDAIVAFDPLDDDHLVKVLDTHVERSNKRYRRLGNVVISLSKVLKEHIVETSEARREYGARPVIRNYEQTVESKLSRLVAAHLVGGNEILADFDGGVVFYQGNILEEEYVADHQNETE